MRHLHHNKKLNRTKEHRKALLKNLTLALLEKEVILTTLAKAKYVRSFVEKIITLSKEDSVYNRRKIFDKLRSNSCVAKLFTEIGVTYKDRPGGYTRILKTKARAGDNAPMAYIELVDRKKNFVADSEVEKSDNDK